MRNHLLSFLRLALLCALSLSPALQAEEPVPFTARYKASYGNFRAESVRSLSFDAASQRYIMLADTRLTLLGGSLSSIHERSEFLWGDDIAEPLLYSYEQKGLGSRSRGLSFDQAQAQLSWNVDDKSGALPFTAPVFDDLTSFMEIRRQLRQGLDTIEFQVADRDAIDTNVYRVLGQEMLTTPLGAYNTVHLERVRDAGNERTTELWLAPDLDYLLLKLRQQEPNGRLIQLDASAIERAAPDAATLDR
ncbi:MAG: DUF3108 domain-containing protein [Pseudomonadales bacterium]|jgi:hypothetical protein|nr:DUF3108 domain-containing protein [Pseudomonadales bacterium]